MIDRNDDLPMSRQAKVLGISRGSVYCLHLRLNGSRTAYLLPNLSKSQNLRSRKRIASQIKLSSKPR
jgi:hypothetical protein